MRAFIIDYGMGNVGSIANMIRRSGGEAIVTADPEAIEKAGKLILPGVGAFDQGMKNLSDKSLLEPVKNAVRREIPMLGICLGMQLMLDKSEEGSLPGLQLVKGEAKRLPEGKAHPKVPHMGWNRITPKKSCALLGGNEPDNRYYFVHSYYVLCGDSEDCAATTKYGFEFTSVFSRGRVYGVQFHPEKSHRFGMALISRFLEI